MDKVIVCTQKYYAGVGSRQTPRNVQDMMFKVADFLQNHGYTLRSGGAEGADRAFEMGVTGIITADKLLIAKEIFKTKTHGTSAVAEAIAATVHPAWHNCSEYARSCHARNVFQILGADLKTKSDFVLCWTPKGQAVGGTATAINLALREKIPVYNLATPAGVFGMMEVLETLLWERIGARGVLGELATAHQS